MADVNNKLRLQIVTQLDEAGIKATKDQIDQLELGLRRTGNSGEDAGQKFGKLEKALGGLPGPIGKIGGALGGLAGTATMVFGAFSLGWEIGNKIVDLAKKFGLMADPIADLKKENEAYNQSIENLKASLAAVTEAEVKREKAAAEATEKAIKKIDDETAAYFRQVTALNGLKNAQGDAEMIQLERAKFEEMKAYSDAGYTEAAEQIGRYYDVLEAELESKRQIEEFDRNSVKLAKELVSAEEAYQKAADFAAKKKAEQASAEADLRKFQEQHSLNGWYTKFSDELTADDLEAKVERKRKAAEKAEADAAKRSSRLEDVDAEVLTRQMERANLVTSGTLSVDRAAQAYDSYVTSAGNPLNAEIDQAWANDLLQKTIEADQTQKDILAEVKNFGDRLERLLEIK